MGSSMPTRHSGFMPTRWVREDCAHIDDAIQYPKLGPELMELSVPALTADWPLTCSVLTCIPLLVARSQVYALLNDMQKLFWRAASL